MRSIFAITFLFLFHFSVNACTCYQRSVERIGLLYENIIKVKVVKSGISDHVSDLMEKSKSIFSSNGSFDSKYEDFKQRSYKIEIAEHLKGAYEGNQIYLGTSTCSALKINFGDEFYIYFDDKPNVGICNKFSDDSISNQRFSFVTRLKNYLNSEKPDIAPIKINEWKLIQKSTSHTVYYKFTEIEKNNNGNRIVWFLINLNYKDDLSNVRAILSSKLKSEVSCSQKLYRDHIEYYFSESNAAGMVVNIDDKHYDSSRDVDSGTWYPINRGFPIHTVMKKVCNS